MNFWAWGGKYIGQRSGAFLYSSSGKPIGRFDGDNLFDFDGNYIGEVRNEKFLIVNPQKKYIRSYSCCEPVSRCGISYVDYCGYAMYAGYEDFVVE